MRLRTKIILLCSLATASISAVAGSVAIIATSAADLERIDSKLNLLAVNSCASQDPIGAALLALDSAGAETEIGFFSINDDYSALSDSSTVIAHTPAKRQMRFASKKPLTVTPLNGDSYRLRTCAMPDSEYLVFATSLKTANQTTASNIALWASLMGGAILVGGLVLWALTRKDLARIEMLIKKAQEISNGDFEVALDAAKGNSELDNLNNSLSQMVETLKAALAAEKSAKQKSKEFLADASHELKTPLTLIRGYSELLNGDTELEPEVAQRSRARIDDQIMRMQSLINDMLLLAELEQTQVQNPEPLNFSEIVTAGVADLKTLHPTRQVSGYIQPGLLVFGSDRLLEQLLANIISNLSRYTSDSDLVRINLSHREGDVVLEVDDSGPGLPEAAYRSGIQYFSRFDPSRSRNSGGSGLGISIMNAIVAQHKGAMQLSESELGGLSTRITLPIHSQIS